MPPEETSCEERRVKEPSAVIKLGYYDDYVVLKKNNITAKVSIDREGNLVADITKHIEK